MMKPETKGLYNSKVFLIVFEYFEKNGITFDEAAILQKAGLERNMIYDHAYWFDQEQSDRFFDACREAVGDRYLGRNVGRFASFSKSMGPVKQYIIGLFSIKTAFRNVSRLYRFFSRGAVVTYSEVKEHEAEIRVKPAEGVDEKLYQCEMRTGSFEAMGVLFTGHRAVVHHPRCIHRGDSECHYIISWEKSGYSKLLVVRRALIFTSLLSMAVLSFLVNVKIFLTIMALLVILNTLLSNLILSASTREQNKRLFAQGVMARNYISEMDERHRQSLIIKEIGNVSTAVLDLDLLLQSIMKICSRHSGFDRGMVLLMDQNMNSLGYRAGYGFKPKEEKLMRETSFLLDDNTLSELVDLVFKEREPFTVQNIREISHLLTGKIKELYDEMGGMSFICLPLYIKNMPRGVVFLGNKKDFHIFTRSEIDFYRGISSQIAVAISNTISLEKLTLNEERMLLAMEATSDAIWDWETGKEEVYISPRGFEMMGYEKGEIVPTFLNWMKLLHPRDAGQVTEVMKKIMNSKEESYTLEFRVDIKKGKKEYRWFQTKARIVKRDSNGRVQRVVGTLIDIHGQRLAEEELLRQKKKAEESDRLKSTFLANMSHEIRTPMNAIIGYTELMQQEAMEPLQSEYLSIIHDSGNLLLSLVSDILDLSRIEAGHMEILLQPFNLHQAVKNISSSMKILLLEKTEKVRFSTHIENNVAPHIIGDELRLQQVMNNLLSNAVKFTSRGTIDLSVRLREGWLELAVSDTGIGISKQEHDRIFKRFQQAEVKTNRRYGGTGLGLTITMLLVEMMGGDIQLESSGINGEGSVFIIQLPYHPVEESGEEGEIISKDKKEIAGSHILLAEDNPVNQLLTRRILQRKGLTVDIASNGKDALDMLGTDKRYDLVIMDLEMPVMNGFEAIRKIRTMDEERRSVPIIALTAHATSDDMKKCKEAGCNDFVTKPVNLLKINQVLSKYI